eukprot:gnl/TRDRNA2_/TRDRNA2_172444_c0_seq2.p1 gnl/TRDRNA2_/TRDRNA2_172444_c0~~gnl/TRDRNA2_/TRDRNA2_172444_c0_seq2.p1  ORF type:complete len:380 (+),score=34.63 gnl/TRDRNA2_/TRDRNA2_172444_c0_seq2:40-1179(+)
MALTSSTCSNYIAFVLCLATLPTGAHGLRVPQHQHSSNNSTQSIFGDWSRNETEISLIKDALSKGQPVVIEPFFTAEFAEQVFDHLANPPVKGSKKHAPIVDPSKKGPGREVYEEHVRQGQLKWMDKCGLNASVDEISAARKLCAGMSGLLDWPRKPEDYSLLAHVYPQCAGHFEGCFDSAAIQNFPYMCSNIRRSFPVDPVEEFHELAQHLLGQPLGPASKAYPYSHKSHKVGTNHFFEGDYFSLHTDNTGERAMAVTLHMTKNANKMKDGGEYLWCGPPGAGDYPGARLFRPGFNRAMLFGVGAESYHAVLPVRKGATVLRRSVQWWYMYPEGGSPSNFHTSPTKSDAVPWSLRSIGNRVRPTVHTESTSNKATCEL